MFKDYLKFFLTGNSNDLSSLNFEQYFEKNLKREIIKEQADYVQKILKVEKFSNLFFAIIANIFMILIFVVATFAILKRAAVVITPECMILEDVVQFCPDPYENNNSASILIIFSFIFVQIIIVLGIIFKLILPYTKNKLLKIHNVNNKLKKYVLDYDTGIFYIFKIGKTRFYVTKNLFDVVDNQIYSINYVKTPRQNIILSFIKS